MTDIRARLDRFLYDHQEGAMSNLDTGNDECRCGKQGTQPWRQHCVDKLLSLSGIAITDTENEATIDRVAEAIWEASVDPSDIPDYRAIARAAVAAAAVQTQKEKPK